MPTGIPSQPADESGRPLVGAAVESWRRAEAERRAAAEAREDIEALARVVCRMAAGALRMPAPDALAAIGAQAGIGGPRGRPAVPAGRRIPSGTSGAALGRAGAAARAGQLQARQPLRG
jgi:hypothetical protein